MNPDYQDLLKRVSLASSKGASIAALDAYIRRESGGALNSIHDLTAAATQKPEAPMHPLGRFGNIAAHDATLGLSDELAGLGAAIVPGGKSYTEGRDEARARYAEATQGVGLPARLAVGLAGGALPAMMAGPLGLAGTGAMSAGRAAAQGLGTGGVFGMIAGAGDSQGQTAGDVAKDALKGGVVGAAVGGVAIPILGAVAKKLGVGVSHLYQMVRNPEAAGHRTGSTMLIKAYQNLGMTPEEAKFAYNDMRQIGGDLVVAADADPNLAAEARRAMTSGPGMTTRILRDQMESRGGGRGARLAGAAEDAMGITRSGVEEAKGQAIRSLRTLGDRLYGKFKTVTLKPDQNMQVEEFLRDPILDQIQPGLSTTLRGLEKPAAIPRITPGMKAADIKALGYKLEGGKLIPPNAAAPRTFQQLQDMRYALVHLKNNLPDGVMPNGEVAQAIGAKVQDLSQMMEDFFPGYHAADAQWRRAAVSTPTVATDRERDFFTKAGVKIQDAYLEGMDALGKTGGDVQKRMADLLEVGGPEAADAFRAGWLESLVTDLRTNTKEGNLAGRLMAMGDDIVDSYKIMFPRPEDFNRMMGRTRVERGMRDTETAIRGARSTVDRGAQSREASLAIEGAGGLLNKSWWSAIRSARIGTKEQLRRVDQAANKHLLKFLTSPPSPENQAMWEELQQMFQQQSQLPRGPGMGTAMGGQVAGQMMGRP